MSIQHHIERIFNLQQANKQAIKQRDVKQRIAQLKLLKQNIIANEQHIYAALQTDLRKSMFEAATTEVYFTYGEIDHAIKHLRSWMKPKRTGANMLNILTRNRIYYEPKGVCLIIAPWNYPFQLVMSPLVSAIAAGNCVIIKPSELSPAISKVMGKIIESTFNENEVAYIEGDVAVSTNLLELPFDHIFFTGSTAIGKVVMTAAAKHLSSLTLELGGQSPLIIDEHINLDQAVEKIAWGKWTNAGQTCIAPNHVYVPSKLKDQFINKLNAAVKQLYYQQDQINTEAYAKIINEKHYTRVKGLVDEALQKGAEIAGTYNYSNSTHTIEPVILHNVPLNCAVMQEEIFGPVLPILSYDSLADVCQQIQQQPKPLALYIFSQKRGNIDYIMANTTAGGTCVNDVLLHISNPKLPFGGVNASGNGSSHGLFGFKAFSHERAVMFQSAINTTKMIYPPYQGKSRVLSLLKRFM